MNLMRLRVFALMFAIQSVGGCSPMEKLARVSSQDIGIVVMDQLAPGSSIKDGIQGRFQV